MHHRQQQQLRGPGGRVSADLSVPSAPRRPFLVNAASAALRLVTSRQRHRPSGTTDSALKAGTEPGADTTTTTGEAIESAAHNRPPPRRRHADHNIVLPWREYISAPPPPPPPPPPPSLPTESSGGSEHWWTRPLRWVTGSSREATASAPQLPQLPTAPPWTEEAGAPIELSDVCVLGVHGWFPIRLVQRVVGEPTGTSQKFCDQTVLALHRFLATHHPDASFPPHAITAIPLEAEGTIDRRIDQLFEQIVDVHGPQAPDDVPVRMRNLASHVSWWQHRLSTCRSVMVSAHSQGTPTAVLLVEKLVETGILDPKTQSIVILAQAGISHGPFPQNRSSLYVQHLEADAARELFEFNRASSPLSERYASATLRLLNCGARLCLVSSWLDQVVPLYSSAYSALHHRNVHRAVFIDAANAYPDSDVLAALVVLSLELRNRGLPDYDLLLYLSDVVAGSLYFGTSGHSTLYEEVRVFELAVNVLVDRQLGMAPPPPSPVAKLTGTVSSWWRGTSTGPDDASGLDEGRVDEFDAPTQLNPYHLPWSPFLRDILADERIVRDPELGHQLAELLRMFRDWDVSGSKVRQTLKYRLDALHRAKL
ncbi:hypothetical protein BC828DRAFT_157517 [Blastocladiella britannica]|nr:hypothetical protein BC828DRAFT_157517 [Blastocladiella britannica]